MNEDKCEQYNRIDDNDNDDDDKEYEDEKII
jgi:hypothetical protein